MERTYQQDSSEKELRRSIAISKLTEALEAVDDYCVVGSLHRYLGEELVTLLNEAVVSYGEDECKVVNKDEHDEIKNAAVLGWRVLNAVTAAADHQNSLIAMSRIASILRENIDDDAFDDAQKLMEGVIQQEKRQQREKDQAKQKDQP